MFAAASSLLLAVALAASSFDPRPSLTENGLVSIEGVAAVTSYTHGEPPPHVAAARFRITNRKQRPCVVRPLSVEYVVDRDVDAGSARATLKPRGIAARVSGGREVPELKVAPGRAIDAEVRFPPVEAFTSVGERLGFRVTFRVDGEIVVAIAETKVIRRQPLRPPRGE